MYNYHSGSESTRYNNINNNDNNNDSNVSDVKPGGCEQVSISHVFKLCREEHGLVGSLKIAAISLPYCPGAPVLTVFCYNLRHLVLICV